MMIEQLFSTEQRGAVEARGAHNPEVGGSKPFAASYFFLLTFLIRKFYFFSFFPCLFLFFPMRALRRVVATLAPLCARNGPTSSNGILLPTTSMARPSALGHARWFSSDDAPASPSSPTPAGTSETEQVEALKREVTTKDAQLKELKVGRTSL